MRKLIKPLVIVAICLTLFGGCFLQQGGWMMNSPKYTEKRLLGLTSAQSYSNSVRLLTILVYRFDRRLSQSGQVKRRMDHSISGIFRAGLRA